MSDRPATHPPPPGVKPLDLFIVLNGCRADKNAIGGGDQVMFKFIRLANTQPDLLIPKSAVPFAATSGRRFLTCSNFRPTLAGITALFSIRILQAVWWSVRNRRVYDVALSSSPFSVDLIPTWLWKARHKGAVVYHIIPERKAVNFATRLRFGLAALEHRLMLKLLRRACDFIVVGNEFTRRQLESLMPGKKMFVLDAGIDAAAIDRVPAQLKDPNLACFVGRLTSQKGVFDLLEVMAAIASIKPEFRLVMAGPGRNAIFSRRKLSG